MNEDIGARLAKLELAASEIRLSLTVSSKSRTEQQERVDKMNAKLAACKVREQELMAQLTEIEKTIADLRAAYKRNRYTI